MIKWADQGVVLKIRSCGENDAIVQVLTQDRGCCGGVLRGIKSKRNQAIQVGTLVSCEWKARLSEHLGTWSMEAETFYLSHMLHDPKRLLALTSASQLTCALLPERHPYPFFFHFWKHFLKALSDGVLWEIFYVVFETHLLQEMGFGLKLKVCSVTNSQENLKYVSPKTGCAVTGDVGSPYHDRLLKLPSFLVAGNDAASRTDILEGLKLTGHFLKKLFPGPQYGHLFEVRQRLIESL